MDAAIEAARAAGRKVAFTLSDTFCVDRHRDGFGKLLDERRIDILFANEAEIQALAGTDDFERRWTRRRQGADPGRHPQRAWRDRAGAAASAPTCPPSRSSGWSTRPAPATCSPPASSPARRAAGASRSRSSSARSPRPK